MPFYAVLAAITVALCWGFNFAACKISLQHFPPFFVIFLRYIIVAVVLLPFARKTKYSLRQLSALAFLMISGHFTLVFTAIWMGLDLSTTVVAIQIGVPVSCVLGAIFLDDRLGAWRTAGMAIAFFGIIIIAGTPSVTDNWIAFLCAMAGSSMWAGSNIYMKKLGHEAIMPIIFWTGLLSLPQTLAVSLLFESDHVELIKTIPWNVVFALLYSGFASTIIGYGLWYWLLKRYDITQVTPYSLLVPIGGFASGILFFNEAITLQLAIGGAITIVGVAIITIRRPKMARVDVA